LVEKGHKDIIYANFETNEPFIEERKAGYIDVLKENGLEPFEFHVINSAHENDWTEILKDKKYTAIMCASDLIALGLINHFKETGIKVPSEVSVTGFDGVQYHNISNPHITTAKQPLYEIGRRLAEVLLEKIYYGEIFMNVFENFDPRIENLGDSIERK
jgi:LacI family transcriptional regulator